MQHNSDGTESEVNTAERIMARVQAMHAIWCSVLTASMQRRRFTSSVWHAIVQYFMVGLHMVLDSSAQQKSLRRDTEGMQAVSAAVRRVWSVTIDCVPTANLQYSRRDQHEPACRNRIPRQSYLKCLFAS
eukprot:TRINITY_DN2017_c0_g2_i4.p3 TRINITY_DN2017_c0_g2~~TRINITY_DN2017_c0_g2_i4.p3  ORF type:complete len:130 (-),score=13.60 TRINITY_DN2017_c0_g2_i4:1536-1925(-)